MTDAAQKLRSFIERIERLQEERKSIADDIADVFGELTSDGFDKDAAKAIIKIRAAKDGLDIWTTRSHVVDTYLTALGMLPEETGTTIATHVHVHEFGSRAETQYSHLVGRVSDAQRIGAVAALAPEADFQPAAFLVKQQKPLRPDCLNPTECAGYGTKQCHACTVAAREGVAA